jgi:hypothetical protein
MKIFKLSINILYSIIISNFILEKLTIVEAVFGNGDQEVNAVAEGAPSSSNLWADDTYENFVEILKQIAADKRFNKVNLESQNNESAKREESSKGQISKLHNRAMVKRISPTIGYKGIPNRSIYLIKK